MNISNLYIQNIISEFSVKRESTAEKYVEFENLICYIISRLFCKKHPLNYTDIKQTLHPNQRDNK